MKSYKAFVLRYQAFVRKIRKKGAILEVHCLYYLAMVPSPSVCLPARESVDLLVSQNLFVRISVERLLAL